MHNAALIFQALTTLLLNNQIAATKISQIRINYSVIKSEKLYGRTIWFTERIGNKPLHLCILICAYSVWTTIYF